MPKKENWSDEGRVVYPSLIPENENEKIKVKYSFNLATDKDNYGLEQEIYAFEAAEGSSEQQNENTCLVIGGKFKNETSYYRIDFTRNDGSGVLYLPLLRNHRYIVLVKEIQGKGYASAEEAFEAGPSNIEAEVMNWNESDDIRYIVVNGHQFMGFTRRAIHFTEETEKHELDLITNLKQFKIQGENWTENSETKAWSNGHFNFTKKEVGPTDVPRGVKYTFTFTTKQNTEGESELRFTGGNMEALLAITQEVSGNGNPDVKPPTGGGFSASEWILAVDKNGALNLDGKERDNNYPVLFKWGSVLAFASNSSSVRPVWIPLGFDTESHKNVMYLSTMTFKQWSYVPYSEEGAITYNEKQGKGDPCQYASKRGHQDGKFRMAKYVGGSSMSEDMGEVKNYSGWSILQNGNISYSAIKFRSNSTGNNESTSQGRYWLNQTVETSAYILNMSINGILTGNNYIQANRNFGYPIRCIPLLIRAKLENESQVTMPREGGSVKIDVRASNSWRSECTIDGVAVDAAKVKEYINPVVKESNIVHKQTATFTMPENKSTSDRKFTLQFVNKNMDLASETIDIVQEGYKGNGNPDVKPPTGGVGASEWILGVDQNGVLNLDGQVRNGNYTVLFRWGSLLAFNSYYINSEATSFRYVPIWAPTAYELSADNGYSWRHIPYSGDDNKGLGDIENNENAGKGDPCKYAVKVGYVKGRFRMAKVDGDSMEDFSNLQKGDKGYNVTSSLLNEAIVYPYTGYREATSDLNFSGKYVTGVTSDSNGGIGLFALDLNGVNSSSGVEFLALANSETSKWGDLAVAERYGAAIRCIPLMLEAKLINEASKNIPSAGGTVKIEVRSSNSWEVKCSCIALSPEEVKKNIEPANSTTTVSHVNSVVFTVPKNDTAADREFAIQFVNSKLDLHSDVITIKQKGKL